MGGDILAGSVIEKINEIPNLKKNTSIAFTGTYSKKYFLGNRPENLSEGGWKSVFDKNDLKVIKTVTLPTIWTFDQPVDTPYIFTKFN